MLYTGIKVLWINVCVYIINLYRNILACIDVTWINVMFINWLLPSLPLESWIDFFREWTCKKLIFYLSYCRSSEASNIVLFLIKNPSSSPKIWYYANFFVIMIIKLSFIYAENLITNFRKIKDKNKTEFQKSASNVL